MPGIWLDADACPTPIRELLYRAAKRTNTHLTVVANAPIRVPDDQLFSSVVVPPRADAADDHIAEQCEAGDLVITADVPLAARIVEKGATGLNPRGELYTEENVAACLAMRNLMDELRGGGLVQGGPAPHQTTHTQSFANALDRYLTQMVRARGA